MNNFILSINPQIFEDDINYCSNTIMEVKVESDGFSARTTMDVDVKELAKFADDLCRLYENLSGEARIEEPYGMHMYISFKCCIGGHIKVKGYLHKGNKVGNEQSLEFENDIDQTCLREFCYDIQSSYCRYLER
jgi:hypothetical protein